MKSKVANRKTHRDRILEAAADCFLDVGLERTTTAGIAHRAKISRRDLYACFSDKRAILAAVVAGLHDDLRSIEIGILSSSGDLRSVLTKSARALMDYLLSDQFGKLARIVASESFNDPQLAKEFFERGPIRGATTLAVYLKEQMKLGNLREAEPVKLAEAFMNMVSNGQLMTAIFLGQADRYPPRLSHVKHAVEQFLKDYSID